MQDENAHVVSSTSSPVVLWLVLIGCRAGEGLSLVNTRKSTQNNPSLASIASQSYCSALHTH